MLPENLPVYPAPAKLNLDLRIVGRRADGYHLLESIFILIDWCDRLAIVPRDDGQIVLHTPIDGVPPEQDLTVRAACALRQAAGCLNAGADIWLDKHLPMGGGLGGGSSDAATVLIVLNKLWNCGLDAPALAQIGVKLGADVPFFLFGESALVRGIGEQLEAVSVPEQWYVVAQPACHVATAAVFAHPDLPRNSPPNPAADYAARQPFRNDMQDIVCRQYPQVAEALAQLSEHGEARMTGSGACVFLPVPNRERGEAVCAALSLPARCVRGLAQHPLREII
ncbi:4-(cytidine 5'-diphospho)-2-C-methyl-D-erythritol kinase [Conchiformibius kuhniae]|uniref:4-diphosphocytidyl-2-C-methyl-D-erythritol kinase n=1 Tax=Conchiformibius kuhniae TaxID=211502 RepID=A0A8T9MWS9_9NEIS|nr:4-(cytidine 5'-diphospho)-2-C-methyl-D-erythritol kinase [Conchiformibius kuhniae]UOP04652.1 4-(cytidine 5'-diphospho)-2-C-methyl-D-erythritol kinase [Conchiformibius kuhniae]